MFKYKILASPVHDKQMIRMSRGKENKDNCFVQKKDEKVKN